MGEKEIHKAVALKYDPALDNAPVASAQGKGKIAERMIELARDAGVPIYDDPDLVNTLSQLDWYEEIPEALYRAVAEILAFTYRLNEKMKRA
jgi:flagellar biosynthesis protein